MVSNGFTVEPEALHRLGQRLGALSGRLAQARGVTQGIDASQFGNQKLTSAAESFVNHWTWQADRLGTTLLDTGSRLTQAAGQYEKVEQAQLAAQGEAPAQGQGPAS